MKNWKMALTCGVVAILFCFLCVGYAALTDSLNISGSVSVDKSVTTSNVLAGRIDDFSIPYMHYLSALKEVDNNSEYSGLRQAIEDKLGAPLDFETFQKPFRTEDGSVDAARLATETDMDYIRRVVQVAYPILTGNDAFNAWLKETNRTLVEELPEPGMILPLLCIMGVASSDKVQFGTYAEYVDVVTNSEDYESFGPETKKYISCAIDEENSGGVRIYIDYTLLNGRTAETDTTVYMLSSYEHSEIVAPRHSEYLFAAANEVLEINFGKYFNIRGAQDISYMFAECNALQRVVFSPDFARNIATDMRYMFLNCEKLVDVNLDGLNADQCRNMDGMFSGCGSITSLDLMGFNVTNCQSMTEMFSGCKSLTRIYSTADWYDANRDMTNMFTGCDALVGGMGTSVAIEKGKNADTYDDGPYAVVDRAGTPGYFTNKQLGSNRLIRMTQAEYFEYYEDLCYQLNAKDPEAFEAMMQALEDAGIDVNADIGAFNEEKLVICWTIMKAHMEPVLEDVGYPSPYVAMFDLLKTGAVSVVFDKLTNHPDLVPHKAELIPMDDLGSGGVLLYVDNEGTVYFLLDDERFTQLNDKIIAPTDLSGIFGYCLSYSYDENGEIGIVLDDENSTLESVKFNDMLDTSNVTNMGGMFGCCTALVDLDLSGINTENVTNMQGMFTNCKALRQLDLPDTFRTANVEDMLVMFALCETLEELELPEGFDTSSVENMAGMFAHCYALKELKLPKCFTASNASDLTYMFAVCRELTSLDLSYFTTEKALDMRCMFLACSKLTSLDVSNFDTSNVVNMSHMFDQCTALEELDLSSFDTSKVTKMQYMFNLCSNLKTIYADAAKWQVDPAVVNGAIMFEGCNALEGGAGTTYLQAQQAYPGTYTGIEFANVDTASDPGYLTHKGKAYSNVMASRADGFALSWQAHMLPYAFLKGDNIDSQYEGIYDALCAKIQTGTGKQVDEELLLKAGQGNVIDGTVYTEAELEYIRTVFTIMRNYYTAHPTLASYAEEMKTYLIDPPTPQKVLPQAFIDTVEAAEKVVFDSYSQQEHGQLSDPVAIDVEGGGGVNLYYDEGTKTAYILLMPETGKAVIRAGEFLDGLFSGCKNLQQILFNGMLDTSTTVSMQSMFSGCADLTTLDVTELDTSNCTNLSNMFSGCSALTSLDVTGFDTSKCTDLSGMFNGCSGLTQLDVTGFDTSLCTDMSSMFYGCKLLQVLDISFFNISSCTNFSSMFSGTNSLHTIYADNETWENLDRENIEDANMFHIPHNDSSVALVGGNGTSLSVVSIHNPETYASSVYAYVDTPEHPGYFTDKNEKPILSNVMAGKMDTTATVHNAYSNIFVSADDELQKKLQAAAEEAIGIPFVATDVIYYDDISYTAEKAAYLTKVFDAWYEILMAAGEEEIPEVTAEKPFALTLPDVYTDVISNATKIVFGKYAEYKTQVEGYTSVAVDAMRSGGIKLFYNPTLLTDAGQETVAYILLMTNDARIIAPANAVGLFCPGFANEDVSLVTEIVFGEIFETSSCENMCAMFFNCKQLAEIDLSGWDTGACTDMSAMFGSCSALTTLTLPENFGIASMNMAVMFRGCTSLEVLDLSNMYTGNCQYMTEMFSDCTNLERIYADPGKWSVSGLVDAQSESIFDGCDKLEVVGGTSWAQAKDEDPDNYLGAAYANVDTAADPGYLTSSVPVLYTNQMAPRADDFYFVIASYADIVASLESKQPELYEDILAKTIALSEKLQYDLIGALVAYIQDPYNTMLDHDAVAAAIALWREILLDAGDDFAYVEDLPTEVPEQSKIIAMQFALFEQLGIRHIKFGTYEQHATNVYGMQRLAVDTLGTGGVCLFYNATGTEDTAYILLMPHAEADVILAPKSCAYMFSGITNVETITFDAFDGSGIENMISMFDGCYSLTEIVLPAGFGYACQNMSFMFNECRSLASLTLPAPDPETGVGFGSVCVDMSSMFYETAFETLALDRMVATSCQNMNYMFGSCWKLTDLSLPAGFGSACEDMTYMFYECKALETLEIPAPDPETGLGFGSACVDMSYMFSNTGFETLKLDHMVADSCQDMNNMFTASSNLTDLSLPAGFGSACEDMTRMFYECKALKTLEIPAPDPETGLGFGSACKTMFCMFAECDGLEEFDVSNLITAKCENMTYMFGSCNLLQYLVLGDDFGSACTTMVGMFESCNELVHLDIGGMNPKACTNMDRMFRDCSELRGIYVDPEKWSDLKNVSGVDMFDECKNLHGANGTSYSKQSEDDPENYKSIVYARVDTDGVMGYFTDKDATRYTNVMAPRRQADPNYEGYMLPEIYEQVMAKAERVSTGSFEITSEQYLSVNVDAWNTGGIKMYYDSRLLDENAGAKDTTVYFLVDEKTHVSWIYAPKNAAYLFAGCENLISHGYFNTRFTENMSHMFDGCTSLTEIDLNPITTSCCTDVSYMFKDCTNLETLYENEVDNYWATTIEKTEGMFEGCVKLSGKAIIDGQVVAFVYDPEKVDGSYAVIYDGTNETEGYLTHSDLQNQLKQVS